MKSAYERAMERMNAQSGESRKLTDDEKQRIVEIDNLYDSKVAEVNVTFDSRIAVASDPENAAALQEELRIEIARLEEKRQHEKDAIWNGAA
jgi:CHASE3 domain sensor protein